MRIFTMKRSAMFLSAAMMLGAAPAQAVPLLVGNHSFEVPSFANDPFGIGAILPAVPIDLVGSIVPVPGFPDVGFGAGNLPLFFGQDPIWQGSGLQVTNPQAPFLPAFVPVIIFPNVPANQGGHITNADGLQLGGINALPTVGMFQLLADVYQVGATYAMTTAFGNALTQGQQPTPGSGVSMEFFYLDDQMQAMLVGSLQVFESELNGSTLIDRTLTLPAVQAGDPWVGEQIGVRFTAIPSFTGQDGLPGGFINLDNVRVDGSGATTGADIPEPATVLGLGLALGAMSLRRRQSRDATRRGRAE